MANTNKNDYNKLAPFYDWLGHTLYFGAIERSQLAYLDAIPKGRRILFIGGGTGFLIDEVLETCRPSELIYIEKSAIMIHKSKKACKHDLKERVTFIHGTQEDLVDGEKYDAVLSFFFFDQFRFPTLSKIFLQLDSHLKPGGLWLWSDFIPPETWWQKILMRTMLLFFDLTTSLGTNRVYSVPEIIMKREYLLQQESFFYGGFIRSVVLKKS